jgi:ribosomal protein S18 acetylase RimI-like enzyme
LSITIALLSHEQRDDIAKAVADFTCRGPRHEDDPTVEFGDRYIREAVWADFDEAGITRTWSAIVEGRICGYLALAADAVHLSRGEVRDAALDGLPKIGSYGCTQIVMLATRADCQRDDDLKVGRALVDHAVLVGREAGSQIGARFLAADVNPPAQGFYERCGFRSLAGQVGELIDKRERGMVPMVFDLHPRG